MRSSDKITKFKVPQLLCRWLFVNMQFLRTHIQSSLYARMILSADNTNPCIEFLKPCMCDINTFYYTSMIKMRVY